MPTNKQLEQELKELKATLRTAGIVLPTRPKVNEEHPNYIAFGSEKHMGLLGLLFVDDDDKEDYITYKGEKGTYRLIDEVSDFMHYPDPAQVAKLVLRSKVGVFEGGPPPIPKDAQSLWVPLGN